jgi:hypothetical protein
VSVTNEHTSALLRPALEDLQGETEENGLRQRGSRSAVNLLSWNQWPQFLVAFPHWQTNFTDERFAPAAHPNLHICHRH